MHPFKVLVANNLVRVIPGRVYTLSDGRVHDAFVVQLSSTDLGDPFLLQTMPTLAVQNNAWLWVKVEFDPDDGSVVSADVVYETEANAQDTYEIRWVKLAKTYSSGLVEQILKENIFISCPDDGMFFKVSKVSNSQVTVQGGQVLRVDYSSLSSIGTSSFPSTNFILNNNLAPLEILGASFGTVAADDEIWLRLDYSVVYGSTDHTSSGGGTVAVNWAAWHCTDAVVEKKASGFDPAVSGVGYGYVKLATIRIVSGKLRVRQHYTGAVTAQCPFVSP
jgi:hypothetical protein